MNGGSMGSFSGYPRSDGRFGIRNLVAVMAAQDSMNPLIRALADRVPGVICLPASYGRGQLGEDLELTVRAMSNLASHPNLASCMVVGFEPAGYERILEPLARSGRAECVMGLSFLESGGFHASLNQGEKILRDLLIKALADQRQSIEAEKICLGSECGGSDAFSGLAANPALGMVVDRLLDQGGTAIFSEPVECLGLEAELASRCVDDAAAKALRRAVKKYVDIAAKQGVDLSGVNPTQDNMAGGLSTIEEKSLGAAAKAGGKPIQSVLEYGQRPSKTGLHLMDAPAAAVENLTALAAGGCQMIMFSTGSGNPAGHPMAPTIKVCANPETVKRMPEVIDLDLSPALYKGLGLDWAADKLWRKLLSVAGGEPTAAERLNFLESNISRVGPSI